MSTGLRVVVTGCKGSGTKWAARTLSSVGVPCTHETFSRHHGRTQPAERQRRKWDPPWEVSVAESSCWAAPAVNTWLGNVPRIVHLVRHPILVMRNWWVDDHLHPLYRSGERMSTLIEMALRGVMAWWVTWNAQVEAADPAGRYRRVRLEDGAGALIDAVRDVVAVDDTELWIPSESDLAEMSKWRQQRSRGPFMLESFDQLPRSDAKTALLWMAERYGYTEDP